jgi:hypothetical protein
MSSPYSSGSTASAFVRVRSAVSRCAGISLVAQFGRVVFNLASRLALRIDPTIAMRERITG